MVVALGEVTVVGHECTALPVRHFFLCFVFCCFLYSKGNVCVCLRVLALGNGFLLRDGTRFEWNGMVLSTFLLLCYSMAHKEEC